ncbi:RNA 2',3'-cyclic phosphodiesterase [Nioella sediminis]|jgi:2'-5' RNA ligase|uniref:RNA 2',3'-cyclic phosphodiesterase n=1 Tax=Nioella sediminis TaxID=1912092 RepID=UPI0008FD6C75|nr:RNA 2',3'-cyclic phosphodiesterase [Nioella sediminis]TBX24653.1 hypothetical protein TK43_11425 [Roseovarius sp. JS7-11]
MRSFLSLDLPDTCRDPLLRMVGGLKAGRVVPWENLHVTLSFLDDQSEERLEELHMALEPLRLPAPELRFAGIDWFGPGKARMLAALVEPVPALVALQAEVERMARRVGMQPERRAFRPHVTLVRFGRHMSEGEAAALQSFLTAPPVVEVPTARATSFSLQGSTLTDQGARYEALAVYPLV